MRKEHGTNCSLNVISYKTSVRTSRNQVLTQLSTLLSRSRHSRTRGNCILGDSITLPRSGVKTRFRTRFNRASDCVASVRARFYEAQSEACRFLDSDIRQAGRQTGGRRRASWSQWLLLPRADSVSISIQWQPPAISIRVGSRSWFHTRHARFFAISRSYVAYLRAWCVRACLLACMHACMHASVHAS